MLAAKLEHIRALNDMSDEEWRFWAKVDTSGDCWVWKAARAPWGYGVFIRPSGKVMRAHRMAWLFTYGEDLPSSVILMHLCDNPACVNPLHLRPGTLDDNSKDMARKGRGGHAPPLSAADVAAIRALYATGTVTQVQLAAQFRCNNGTICRLVQGVYPAGRTKGGRGRFAG